MINRENYWHSKRILELAKKGNQTPISNSGTMHFYMNQIYNAENKYVEEIEYENFEDCEDKNICPYCYLDSGNEVVLESEPEKDTGYPILYCPCCGWKRKEE